MTEWKAKLPGFCPGLAIVQVGGREDSNVYIRMKIKAANDIGIEVNHLKLPRTITEQELMNKVNSIYYYSKFIFYGLSNTISSIYSVYITLASN